MPGANWQEHLAAADFQRIAADADRLGFDAISVPEHIVLPRELAGHMGGRWPDALTAMALTAAAPRPTTTRQVVDLIADLDAAGRVAGRQCRPLGDGPQSLKEHSDYLEWAATEVMPAFRRSAA